MTSGMRGVRGEGEAVVFLHQTSESVVEIRGQFARIGGLDSEGIVGVDLRMVTRVWKAFLKTFINAMAWR